MCGCLGICTCPAHSAVSASQALAARRAAIPPRLGHLGNFGSPAVPSPGAETGSAPSYEQPTSIWRLDRLRRSRRCGSQKWEPTCSAALGRSTTRSDSSRRSVAPHSTQSDGDRRPDPLWSACRRSLGHGLYHGGRGSVRLSSRRIFARLRSSRPSATRAQIRHSRARDTFPSLPGNNH